MEAVAAWLCLMPVRADDVQDKAPAAGGDGKAESWDAVGTSGALDGVRVLLLKPLLASVAALVDLGTKGGAEAG